MTHGSRGLVAALLLLTPGAVPSEAQETSRAVIKTETRVVLIDAVVTNKKGEFVHDLSTKDFKVLEDNREQKITSFSFEADPASPASNQPRYLMFFFDNASLDLPHQQPIRDAAAQFAAANAGPRRLMAVTEYGPDSQVTQDFTSDGERLKQAISTAKLAHRVDSVFDARNLAWALESMAKRLGKVPGRKSLVLVSGGMNQIPEDQMTRVIDVLNRANVAVYPGADLAGIRGSAPAGPGGPITGNPGRPGDLESISSASVKNDGQQLLRNLTDKTGGSLFYLKDLSGGLERIGKEQNEYYLLGYSPDGQDDGKCHHLKVKAAESGLIVRSRELYCPVKPADLLSGTPVEKDLETLAAASAPGNVTGFLNAPFFYTDSKTVRVAIALAYPTSAVSFEKRKGNKYHGQLNLLGVFYQKDGGAVAARFSDTIELDFDTKKAMDAWRQKETFDYEKDVDALPGTYTLKVVIGSNAEHFAKMELPVAIEAYGGEKLGLSGISFSTNVKKVDQDPGASGVASEDTTPLVANEMQFFPSAHSVFKKTESVAVYAEFYEPALKAQELPSGLVVAVRMRLTEAKTGKVRLDSGVMRQDRIKPGQPVIPVGLMIPIAKLEPGEYVCELGGGDTAGGQVRRVVRFTVE